VRSALVWLATIMLLPTALWGSPTQAQEIPVIDVMVVAPEGFESDVSAARLISDASKIYESNGLLSLRFAGLVRVHRIPEILSGDLGAMTAWTVSSYDGPGGVFRNRPGDCSG